MKNKTLIIGMVLLSLLFVGCGKLTTEEYDTKEQEFYTAFEEISKELLPIAMEVVDGGQITQDIYSDNKLNQDILLDTFDRDSIPEEKQEDYELLDRLSTLILIHLGDTIGADMQPQSVSSERIKQWEEYIELSEKLFTKYGRDMKDIQYAYDPLARYMDENNIKLTAKDVQFDMESNLDKKFAIMGSAELDDYYNYGFDDIEGDYFCVQVEPYGGKYSDRWYLYFHRDSFEALFNKLKQGDRTIIATCTIPKYRYKNGMNNMAIVKSVRY